MMTDTDVTDIVPTDPEDAVPLNTFTEPSTEDPTVPVELEVSSNVIPQDELDNTLHRYYTDLQPVDPTFIEGILDSFVSTDPNGTELPPLITITGISTTTFPYEGGLSVTITGTNLSSIVKILIESVVCTITSINAGQIIFTTSVCPYVDPLQLTNLKLYDSFDVIQYETQVFYQNPIAPFALTSTDVSSGTMLGNTVLNLTGTGFYFISEIKICNQSVASFNILSSQTIEIITAPCYVPGIGDIVVTDFNGVTLTLPNAFEYTRPAPVFYGVSDLQLSTTQPKNITIVGKYFTDLVTLLIGGVNVPFIVISDTEILVPSLYAPTLNSTSSAVSLTTTTGSTSVPGYFESLPPPNAPVITKISPTVIDIIQPQTFTIEGSNFTGATSVLVGGIPATFGVVSDSLITGTYPSNVYTGLYVDVQVDTTIKQAAVLYKYPALKVISLDVTSGSILGGDIITITGDHFYLIEAISICGVQVRSFTVVSPQQIICTTETTNTNFSGTAGNVFMKSTLYTDILYNAFTYVSISTPIVTSIVPNADLDVGGNVISVYGSNLLQVTAIELTNGVQTITIPSFTIVFDNILTFTVPQSFGSSGLYDLKVTNSYGFNVFTNIFSYIGTLAIINTLDVIQGSTNGGTTVTVSGTNFNNITQVQLNGLNVASFTIINNTSFSFVTPTYLTSGLVNLEVTNVAGLSTKTNAFYYYYPITITSATPNNSNITGGTSVVIAGSGFENITSVQVCGIEVTSFTIDSLTQITAIVDTTVTPSTGAITMYNIYTSGLLIGAFTYYENVTIASISPSNGEVAGGTSVTITGTGFRDVTSVSIGGANVTSYTVVSPTQITATTGANTFGSKSVDVVTSFTSGTLPSAFVYYDPIVVSTISPISGNISGGTSVTITGTGFRDITSVSIGGVNVTNYTVVSDTQITATTDANTYGTKNVVVTSLYTSGTKTNAFTYYETIGVSTILPDNGSIAGGTSVTISGTGFRNITSVAIGGVNVTSYTVDSDTQITAITGSIVSAGLKNVVVTSTYTSGTLTNGFTYFGVMTVTSLSRAESPTNGGITTVITGTNFVAGITSVTCCGVNVTNYTVDSSTQITAVVASNNVTGLGDVVITSPYNSVTKANAFTYFTNVVYSNALFSAITASTIKSVYHLRVVVNTYSGPVLKIRRSSDNAEIDIWSSPFYEYRTAAFESLSTWLSSATAYITTWYDQSSNGRDATQTVTSLQPEFDYSNHKVIFTGTKTLDVPNSAVQSGNGTYSFVFKHSTIASSNIIFSSGASGTSDSMIIQRDATTLVNTPTKQADSSLITGQTSGTSVTQWGNFTSVVGTGPKYYSTNGYLQKPYIHFDSVSTGSTDYLNVAGSYTLNCGTNGGFTYIVQMYPTTSASSYSYYTDFSTGSATRTDAIELVYAHPTQKLGFTFYNGGSTIINFTSTNVYARNQWLRIAFVVTNGASRNLALYVNDVLDSTVSIAADITNRTIVNTSVGNVVGYNNLRFNGYMDSLYVYDRALTVQELQDVSKYIIRKSTYVHSWGTGVNDQVTFGFYSTNSSITCIYDQTNRKSYQNSILQNTTASASKNQTASNTTLGSASNTGLTELNFFYIFDDVLNNTSRELLENDSQVYSQGYSVYPTITDISTATNVNASSSRLYGGYWAEGFSKFLVLDDIANNSTPLIASTDAINWTRLASTAVGANDTMRDIVANGSSSIVTVGNASVIRRSTDGTTFTKLVTSAQGYGVAYGNGVYVSFLNTDVYRSTDDGVTWTTYSSALPVQGGSIVFAGGSINKFFILPRPGNNVYSSTNGVTWTSVGTLTTNDYYFSTAWSPEQNKMMTISWTGWPVESTDGITWTNLTASNISSLGDNFFGINWIASLGVWAINTKRTLFISKTGQYWQNYSLHGVNTTTFWGRYVYSPTLHKGIFASDVKMVRTESDTRQSTKFTSGNSLSIPGSTSFYVSSSFTFEWFQYQEDIVNPNYDIFAIGTFFKFNYSNNTFTITIGNQTELTVLNSNILEKRWVHIAISRSLSTCKLFINGKLVGSSTNLYTHSSSNNLVIGNNFVGLLSNIHFSTGVAYYTSDFVPPTSEIIPDYNNTQLLIINGKDVTGKTITNSGTTLANITPF